MRQSTQAAHRAQATTRGLGLVVARRQLAARNIDDGHIRSHCAAGRWQVRGTAVVLHNDRLSRREQWLVARINCGPHALLTAFTALEILGLQGWRRDRVHVLAPNGAANPRSCGLRIRLHRTRQWHAVARTGVLQRAPGAALLAAADLTSPRWACGLLAATVQQRLASTDELAAALASASRLRYRALLSAAVSDISGGSQALSEIDFYRLCRRHDIPLPERQTVRHERSGRRRYLDATWRRADGRLVVVEVDGALHLAVRQWWQDQARQNELSIDGALVLRFPSVMVRTDELQVVEQLRRALQL
jgi:hypothetical protein